MKNIRFYTPETRHTVDTIVLPRVRVSKTVLHDNYHSCNDGGGFGN